MQFQDLSTILLSEKPSKLLKKQEKELFIFIPELQLCKGFLQNNIWHIYDVYEHILHVVDNTPCNFILRLAALFHDIGKPVVYFADENGVGHFYNHWQESKNIFLQFADKINLDDKLKNQVAKLIYYHDINFQKITTADKEKFLKEMNKNEIEMLFDLKRSDLLAQNPQFHSLLNDYIQQKEELINNLK